MRRMEWKENKNPEIEDRQIQYDFIEIDEDIYLEDVIGSIWLSRNNDWNYETEYQDDFLDANNLEDAKKEFQKIYREECEDTIDYHSEIITEQKRELELLDVLESMEEE